MLISKEATGSKNRRNQLYFTQSCRNAIKQILVTYKSETKVLIPAYIGLSLEEGSGILDPIKESNSTFDFYNIDAHLDPNLESLEAMLTSFKPSHVLVVNYFGFISANRTQVFELLSKYSVCIIEDFAHMLDSLHGTRHFPQLADFEVYSLHKTIGAGVGGGALLCKSSEFGFEETISTDSLSLFAKSDLDYISKLRFRNYDYLLERMKSLYCDCIQPFFSDGRKPISPLNFPLRLRDLETRHRLYEFLVEAQILPTALYHRLVKELQLEQYSLSLKVSQTILNLPTHQDVELEELDAMVEKVRNFCNEH
jgi:dTDP-4-amino-4,6-dideoxygalactose transaminase